MVLGHADGECFMVPLDAPVGQMALRAQFPPRDSGTVPHVLASPMMGWVT